MDATRHSSNPSLRRAQTKALRNKNTLILRSLKNVPCADCGNKFHFAAMEFDHRPGEVKLFNVGDGSRRGSIRQLLDEIAKCEVVCANCHAVRTWNRSQLA